MMNMHAEDGRPPAVAIFGRLGPVAVLVLLNGAPGVGKSTLARRLTEDRPLSLNVDIDEIRVRMGQWAEHPESKRMARQLALGMIASHLTSGDDVVVPQMVSNPAFVDELRRCATEAGATFKHIALVADSEDAVARMRRRRSRLLEDEAAHPLATTDPARDIAATESTHRAIHAMGATLVATSDGATDAAYDTLASMLNGMTWPRALRHSVAPATCDHRRTTRRRCSVSSAGSAATSRRSCCVAGGGSGVSCWEVVLECGGCDRGVVDGDGEGGAVEVFDAEGFAAAEHDGGFSGEAAQASVSEASP